VVACCQRDPRSEHGHREPTRGVRKIVRRSHGQPDGISRTDQHRARDQHAAARTLFHMEASGNGTAVIRHTFGRARRRRIGVRVTGRRRWIQGRRWVARVCRRRRRSARRCSAWRCGRRRSERRGRGRLRSRSTRGRRWRRCGRWRGSRWRSGWRLRHSPRSRQDDHPE
jgi:hypothetical protein